MCQIPNNSLTALIAVIAGCWLTACSGDYAGLEEANRQGILHFGNGTEPQSLDPHVMTGVPEVTIASALFEGLITLNPHTLEPEPGAAQEASHRPEAAEGAEEEALEREASRGPRGRTRRGR